MAEAGGEVLTCPGFPVPDDAPYISAKAALLEEALKIVTGPRQQLYGKPSQNFIDTAAIINSVLGEDRFRTAGGKPMSVKPYEVAIIMICLKLARIRTSPQEKDHWVDIAGYAACGYEAALEGE